MRFLLSLSLLLFSLNFKAQTFSGGGIGFGSTDLKAFDDLEEVKKLFESGKIKIGEGFNPLVMAKNAEVAKYLIEKGADPNQILASQELSQELKSSFSVSFKMSPEEAKKMKEVRKVLESHRDPEKVKALKRQMRRSMREFQKEARKLQKKIRKRNGDDQHADERMGDWELARAIEAGDKKEEERLKAEGFSLINSRIKPAPYCKVKEGSEKVNMPNLPKRSQDGVGWCYGFTALQLVQQAYCEEKKEGCDFTDSKDDRLSAVDTIYQGLGGHLVSGHPVAEVLKGLSGKTVAKESACPVPWGKGDKSVPYEIKKEYERYKIVKTTLDEEKTEAGYCASCVDRYYAGRMREVSNSGLGVDEIAQILKNAISEEEETLAYKEKISDYSKRKNIFIEWESFKEEVDWTSEKERKKIEEGSHEKFQKKEHKILSQKYLEKITDTSKSWGMDMNEASRFVDRIGLFSFGSDFLNIPNVGDALSPEARHLGRPYDRDQDYGDTVLPNYLFASKKCKGTEKLPEFDVHTLFKSYDSKKLEETLDKNIENGKLVGMSLRHGGSEFSHAVTIQGKREICCEGQCKKQYRIKDSSSFQKIWGYRDEWVDAGEVISRSYNIHYINVKNK